MKYELIGENDYFMNPLHTVLNNRGINDIDSFLSIDESSVNDWRLLKNIDEAVDCLLNHVENGSKGYSPTDSDLDGCGSNAILINYMKEVFPSFKIEWDMPKGKEHGVDSDRVPEDTGIVIVTDAGSNQHEEHAKLRKKGIDVIVIDHHECNKESKNAIVVNSQLSPDYPNKQLAGGGMVYKFCKALDNRLGINHADYYLDLVAMSCIADVQDLREPETRYYVYKGLDSINNSFLKELIKKQSYSMKGILNVTNVSFYIAPLINAAMRIASMEEKEQMMRAFLESDEQIFYKRGKVERWDTIQVDTARVLGNVKNKQARERDKGLKLIEERIAEKNLLDNKILIVNVTDILDKNLTGLVANKLLDKYQRPALLIRKNKKNKNIGGSARGYDRGAIKDLKQFLTDTEKFVFCEGHPQAHGFEIEPSKLLELNDVINDKLKDIKLEESVYYVDFIIPFKQFNTLLVKELHEKKNMFGGKNMDEPLIAVKDIEISVDNIELLGKNASKTLKFKGNGIEFIKFFYNEDKFNEDFSEDGTYIIDIVGRCGMNDYNNVLTPQIIMEEYEIKKIKEKELIF